jgi:hypothetical protein
MATTNKGRFGMLVPNSIPRVAYRQAFISIELLLFGNVFFPPTARAVREGVGQKKKFVTSESSHSAQSVIESVLVSQRKSKILITQPKRK